VIGCYGLPEASLIEIIGAENIGKSTLLHWILGGAMLEGIPCAVQETEAKELTPHWAGRAMHPDRKLSQRMLERLDVFPEVFELTQMEDNLYDWVHTMRVVVGVPKSTPLIMAVDSWSKLMNSSESAGFYDYGDNMDAKAKAKKKGTNEGSNFVHAKWAHAWCRKLPSFLATHNVMLIIISHQNDSVDMTGGSSFMSAESGALWNKKKIGGRAFNQNASLQLILSRSGVAKDSAGTKIGTNLKMRVDKNSFGPTNRIMEYMLKNDRFVDSESRLEPNLMFHEGLAKWFADERIKGTTASRKRYTCEALGVVNATSEDFETALNSCPAALNEIGQDLKIYGYEDVVDIITADEGATVH